MASHQDPSTIDPTLVEAHTQGWSRFTRFMTIGTACVVLVLLMFVLQFAVGWGYAMLFLIVGVVGVIIAARMGKL